MEIGESMRKHRKERKLTQDELAKAVGVSITTIKNWENGVHVPTDHHIKEISQALGVTESMLLYGIDFPDYDSKDGKANSFVRASVLTNELVGLFAGGGLTEEDKEIVMQILSRAFISSKKDGGDV